MRTSQIGRLEVSVVGLGCNNFGRGLDQAESEAVVHAALEEGVTYFDTARTYGEGRSESFLAAGLGNHRNSVVVATKFGRIPRQPHNPGAGRADVRRSLEKSLDELNTDYVDLYQLHFPDPDVPIEETLGVLNELIEEGKVREVGCANFDVPQLEEALSVSSSRQRRAFAANQVHYSMVHRDPEASGLVDWCVDTGTALLPYYPLASGLLTGKTRRGQAPRGRLAMERYRRFLTDDNFGVAERVAAFAAERRLSPSQVALRWLLTRPAVAAVTPGATRPEHVVANVAAADWEADEDDLSALERVVEQ